MPFSFRRSKKIGPLRIGLSRRGLSGSVGAGRARVGRSRRGSWFSFRLPGGLTYRRRGGRMKT